MKNTNLLLALLSAAFFVSCSKDSKQQFTLLSSSETGIDFVNQLNSKQYKAVEKFFATMPKLSHKIDVVNPNTKEKSSIVLEGLADFFV